MKKKYLVELIIAILLVVIELIVILVMYPEALTAQNTDVSMTALLAIFINVDILYGIIIIIFNGDWRKQ
jgi:heme/copper-type cytochrome/quinol oxidase subunit 4